MDLGTRQIRTAGKGSGSVELTLPGQLRRLVGLPCRILLHDGERPDIVLQPDMAPARAAFASLWLNLALAMLGAPVPDFPVAAFAFGLLPRHGAPDTPYLCWEDGLAIAEGTVGPEAVARCIAACARLMAAELGVAAPLADPFACVCGFAAIGRAAFVEWQPHCDIASAALAHRENWRPDAIPSPADPRSDAFWRALKPRLQSVCDLFNGWSLPGSAYPELRTAWQRGRSIEMNRG